MLVAARNSARAVVSLQQGAPASCIRAMSGSKGGSEEEEANVALFRERADWEAFREHGHELVDFIADYYKRVESMPVKAQVKPGYLKERVGERCPEEPEDFAAILRDIDLHIMPGITHWQHPRFGAYFSANSSWPGLAGEMLSGMFNVIGFSWVASPAASELETIVMDWLGDLIGLPEEFLTRSGGSGGGVIQGTASEATLVALVAARARAMDRVRQNLAARRACLAEEVSWDDVVAEAGKRFVVYTSDQSHSSVKKAAMIAGTGTGEHQFRTLPTSGPQWRLEAATLAAAVDEDLAAGRIPLMVIATLGTTGIGACDPLDDVGRVAEERGLWMHVDAAWAGSALVCPEHRAMLRGVERVDSFDFNPHKWLLTNFDCSAMWVRDRHWLLEALSLTPTYLRSKEYDAGLVTDYRDWQVPLGRRFRALKLWMVLRSFGARGLRGHIASSIRLAERFAAHVEGDARFEMAVPRSLALVCFHARGATPEEADRRSTAVMDRANAGGATYIVSTTLGGRVVLRFATGTVLTQERHIDEAWAAIAGACGEVLREEQEGVAGGTEGA